MKIYVVGLLVICALGGAAGCSTDNHTGAAANPTTRNGTVLSSRSALDAHSTNAVSKVNTIKATVTLEPRPVGSMTCQTFLDSSRGWVVMGHEIFNTVDGGTTWDKLSTVNGDVRDLGFVSSKHGWLFTGNSLEMTEDGGRTWHSQGLPHAAGITLGQAQFVDAEHGWILGTGEGKLIPNPKQPGSGEIPSIVIFWSTSNGGKTWTRMNVPTKIANHEFEGSCDFSFISPKQGFLLMGTQPGTGLQGKSLYRTIDGGRHWTKVTSTRFDAPGPKEGLPGGGYISGLDFLTASTGWLSEVRGPIYTTTDGGQTWKPILSDHPSRNIGHVHFLGLKHGYAIYRNSLLETNNGGTAWKQIYPSLWPSMFISSRFFNARDGISVGTVVAPRAILKTTDGGFTWKQIASVPGSGRIVALSFPDSQHGWVISDDFNNSNNRIVRIIYRTTDGGLRWTAVASTTQQKSLYADLSFVDSRTGFVASGWGHLFVTHDGGSRLTMVDNKDSGASQIQFVSPYDGWKIMNHHLYSTSDAGKTWHMIILNYMPRIDGNAPLHAGIQRAPIIPTNYIIVNFDRVNADTAWVIALSKFASPSSPGAQGTTEPLLLSTSNGGTSWTIHHLGHIYAAGVDFADPEHGWLVDDHNDYFRTDDGGETWNQVNVLAR